MKWIAVIFIVIVCITGGLYLVGRATPQQHHARRSVSIAASPQMVWARIRNVGEDPSWRPEVKRVESAPPLDGQPCFVEQSSLPITLCVERDDASGRVVRVRDAKHQSGGTWTFAVSGDGASGSRVTLTEDADVYSPLWRGMLAVTGRDRSIRRYFSDLTTSFGEHRKA